MNYIKLAWSVQLCSGLLSRPGLAGNGLSPLPPIFFVVWSVGWSAAKISIHNWGREREFLENTNVWCCCRKLWLQGSYTFSLFLVLASPLVPISISIPWNGGGRAVGRYWKASSSPNTCVSSWCLWSYQGTAINAMGRKSLISHGIFTSVGVEFDYFWKPHS